MLGPISLLRLKKIRYYFVYLRYRALRRNLVTKQDGSEKIGKDTISHNLKAFEHLNAAFGCGERMGIIIHPIVGYYHYQTIPRDKIKILVVGCRTEDDIYWLKSYGFKDTKGFDLISYSDNIIIGDIHNTVFEDNTYDVVILGWMISYTSDPDTVVNECRRILKPGGLLALSVDHNPNQDYNNLMPPRVNPLNTTAEMKIMLDKNFDNKVIFEYDHDNFAQGDLSTVLISKCI